MFNFLSSTNGFWPYLFNHDKSDFGVFLRLGNIEIRWYAICILLGALLSLLRCKYELKKKNMPTDLYDNFFLTLIPIAIVGARLWYVISCPEDFDGILEILGFSNGTFQLSGLAIQGGVILGVIWGIIYFKFINKRYPLAFHVDMALPAVFIGQFVGRWGNFFNQEVYGKVVDRSSLWFIPSFIIDNAAPYVSETSAHIPLFIVESFINFIGFILIGYVAYRFWKKGRKPYQIASLYFIWYGTARLILEPLRDEEFIMNSDGIPTSIVMSILFIVLGVSAFIASAIIYRKLPFEKIYVNEQAELLEKQKQEELEKEIQEKIAAKKAEIRARKAKESQDKNNV